MPGRYCPGTTGVDPEYKRTSALHMCILTPGHDGMCFCNCGNEFRPTSTERFLSND